MFTKQADLPSHLGVVKISNLPALHEPKIDLYVLALIRHTGSRLTAPLLQSYLHEHYSQHVRIYTDGSATVTTAGDMT